MKYDIGFCVSFCYFSNHLLTGHNLISVHTSGVNSLLSICKDVSIGVN